MRPPAGFTGVIYPASITTTVGRQLPESSNCRWPLGAQELVHEVRQAVLALDRSVDDPRPLAGEVDQLQPLAMLRDALGDQVHQATSRSESYTESGCCRLS